VAVRSYKVNGEETISGRRAVGIGAIAFYLAHEPEVDANIGAGEEEIDRSVQPLSDILPVI